MHAPFWEHEVPRKESFGRRRGLAAMRMARPIEQGVRRVHFAIGDLTLAGAEARIDQCQKRRLLLDIQQSEILTLESCFDLQHYI